MKPQPDPVEPIEGHPVSPIGNHFSDCAEDCDYTGTAVGLHQRVLTVEAAAELDRIMSEPSKSTVGPKAVPMLQVPEPPFSPSEETVAYADSLPDQPEAQPLTVKDLDPELYKYVDLRVYTEKGEVDVEATRDKIDAVIARRKAKHEKLHFVSEHNGMNRAGRRNFLKRIPKAARESIMQGYKAQKKAEKTPKPVDKEG